MALWLNFTRGLAFAVTAGAVAITGGLAEAQTRTVRNTQGPAEVPPASYSADQYIDSQGCLFIRAGFGDTTRWVPRVNRDRTVVCGQTPSRRPVTTTAAVSGPATPATTAAPTATAAPVPVETIKPVIRRQPAAAAPRQIVEPAPRRAPIRQPSTAPARVATAPRPAAPRPAAPRPVHQAVAPHQAVIPVPVGCGASDLSARYLRNTPACAAALRATTPTSRVTIPTGVATPNIDTTPAIPRRAVRSSLRGQTVVAVTPPAHAVRVNPNAPSPNRATGRGAAPVTTGCAGASELSSRYLRRATRCGGDKNWSLDGRRSSSVETATTVTSASTRNGRRTVIVPAARTTFDVSHPPKGYRAAWRDGRLNPNRGPRTLEGDYQSQGIWTNETPRRLRPIILVTQ